MPDRTEWMEGVGTTEENEKRETGAGSWGGRTGEVGREILQKSVLWVQVGQEAVASLQTSYVHPGSLIDVLTYGKLSLSAVVQWFECGPANLGPQVRFPVRAHAQVGGEVPIKSLGEARN